MKQRFGVILGLLLVPGLAWATVMREVDLPTMVTAADKVFVGKVLSTKSLWTEDRKHIVTDAVVEVVEDIQGTTVGEKLTIRRLGGTVDGLGMKTFGVAILKPGQKVLLFTGKERQSRAVVGMSQGALHVQTTDDGREVVRRSLREVHFLPPAAPAKADGEHGKAVKALTVPRDGTPLAEVIKTIRETIAACAQGACSPAPGA